MADDGSQFTGEIADCDKYGVPAPVALLLL